MSAVVPPATNDHWSYAHEIKSQFDGTPDISKDRPAHWYEAQLVHYGLPPSKNKGTAKMRLYEALSKGSLAVPGQILKLEADLKKEWTKRDREAKQALKNQSTATTTTTAKGATKRKATDDNTHGSFGSTSTAKKARTIATPKPKAAPKPAAAASGSSRPPPPASSPPSAAQPSRPIQTARRSHWNGPIGGHAQGSSNPPQFSSTPSTWDSYNNNNHNDDPPPPYPGSPTYSNQYDYHHPPSSSNNNPSLPPLGLLNGRYAIELEDKQFDFEGRDSGMILTLDGNALWGQFEIGPLSGIWKLEQRPYQASRERLYFKWRGEDDQGGEYDESNDGSYIVFLGEGRVSGGLRFYGDMMGFTGWRVSGRGETRSEVGVGDMRREWAGRGMGY
ncbi:hypothetical protein B0T21DRAFT_417033 [Apiosordaria backusii]|uniref:Uncharacterized protein n=1 Tax=Apiosordaria backusii TaxID=314023 RepID=A0AA39ZQ21_9PEZI|nr:hypothetical protein B0T21DRAFT_417033 [Apiosordaria backusii]